MILWATDHKIPWCSCLKFLLNPLLAFNKYILRFNIWYGDILFQYQINIRPNKFKYPSSPFFPYIFLNIFVLLTSYKFRHFYLSSFCMSHYSNSIVFKIAKLRLILDYLDFAKYLPIYLFQINYNHLKGSKLQINNENRLCSSALVRYWYFTESERNKCFICFFVVIFF